MTDPSVDTPAILAAELTYMQRKALRRIGRGKGTTNTMYRDAFLRQFYHFPNLPELPENYDVIDWVDWESKVRNTQPVLSQLGEVVLAALNDDERMASVRPNCDGTGPLPGRTMAERTHELHADYMGDEYWDLRAEDALK